MASSVSSRRNALETVEAEKDSLRALSLTEPMENTISAMNNAPRYKSDPPQLRRTSWLNRNNINDIPTI
ncbi:hypothetical protein [Agrobacterium rhizogenes]|jgi:hypothetical protein|uniref:Uncharacterized protein n=2 Tax=unclassified Rhizobium TaxID=2613769 RepID=A0AAU7SHT3_9HYPH